MVVLVTHLHGDHVNGLLGLLQTMSMSQRGKRLTLVGPEGLSQWVKASDGDAPHRAVVRPAVRRCEAGGHPQEKSFLVRCARASHSVEAWSYLFEETPRSGVFDSKKAVALGVPEGRKWSTLQHGRSVVVGWKDDTPGPRCWGPREGRKVGYSGDTRPSPTLARFFAGADLLIFDSTFAARDADKAVERKHSTSAEAAELRKGSAREQARPDALQREIQERLGAGEAGPRGLS